MTAKRKIKIAISILVQVWFKLTGAVIRLTACEMKVYSWEVGRSENDAISGLKKNICQMLIH